MSTFEAIRGVSDTLRRLLRDRMELPADVTDWSVTVGQPRSNVQNPTEGGETARANLFLYRTQHNAALRNQDIPGRGHPAGQAVPPLSLDLFYLVTAYGTKEEDGIVSETLAHALLGSAMRVFHDFPIITDGLVTTRPPVGIPILHRAVRDDFERLKITPEPLSLEDLSKIWTALTLPFRAGAAYQVSVIQIESRRPRRSAPLVLEPPPAGPFIVVVPLPRPVITNLRVHRPTDPAGSARPAPFVRAGDTLVIEGEQLAGESVAVRVGSAEFPLGQTTDPGRIEFVFNPPPDLAPGAHAVEVVRGLGGVPGPGVLSNQAVVMLVPLVQGVTTVGPRQLRITGNRLTFPGRTGQVAVGPADIPDTAYLAASASKVSVALPDTLPASKVPVLVSAPFPSWAGPVANPLSLNVSVSGAAATKVEVTPPVGVADAAELLQRALRDVGLKAAPVSPPLAGARVAVDADQRLVVVAGGLTDSLTFTGPNAPNLGLTQAAGAVKRTGYLSGVCDPFPPVPATSPEVNVTIVATQPVRLPARPTSLAGCAAALETAVRGSAGGAAFANARVVVTGSQMLLVPGTPDPVRVEPSAGDIRSAGDLRLSGVLPVRVRVSGAESVDDRPFDVT